MINPVLLTLASTAGVHLHGAVDFQAAGAASSTTLAMDAQPQLITQSSDGIPAFLSTYVDPKLIKILVAPMKGAEIAGSEVKKGDWTTRTAMFSMIEATGETSSYGDWNNNGRAGINFQFPQRQSYHYQVITIWGERQMAEAGLAQIDYANQLNQASILTLNKFQNKTYFYGVKGLQLYGILNDPNLFAPIAPLTVGGQTTWANKDGQGVYEDIRALVAQLVKQGAGIIDMDTPMTLVMSPNAQMAMAKTNQFNQTVADLLRNGMSNLKFKTAPEYSTTGGEMLQLFADNVDGQQTMEVAFTEKLRTHGIVKEMSAFKQKKSQGTWGGIIYRPMFVAAMLGV